MYATLTDDGAVARARALAEAGRHPALGGTGGTPVDAPVLDVLEDQICAEAGVWAPEAAGRALRQAAGDVARAVALVRVWAATLPPVALLPVADGDVCLLRRVSAAFEEIPGGQWLGATREFSSRLLDWDDPAPAVGANGSSRNGDTANGQRPTPPVPVAGVPPMRTACPRVRDLLAGLPLVPPPDDGPGPDPAWSPLTLPVSRGGRLAALARGETGALVALASLILAGRREAVLTEATLALAGVRFAHPRTGRPCVVAEVPVVEAEAVLDAEPDGRPGLAVGYGASLGSIERRGLAMALLDGALQADAAQPATVTLDDGAVLAASDGPGTSGFVEHLRLPHYATFAAYLAQLERPAAPSGDCGHDDCDDDACGRHGADPQ